MPALLLAFVLALLLAPLARAGAPLQSGSGPEDYRTAARETVSTFTASASASATGGGGTLAASGAPQNFVDPVNDAPDFALRTEAVVAWGANGSGQTNVPSGLSGVGAIAAGGYHTVALKTDGTVAAWGGNGNGQTDVPSGLTGVRAIAAGYAHTVALKADGTVVAWGDNYKGQTNVPSGLSGVRAIAAGYLHTVALKTNGTVVAWGDNYNGQTTVPLGLSGVSAIGAGLYYTVALKTDGTVVAWGWGPVPSNMPRDISGVMAIAAGDAHTVVLRTNGTVGDWGDNSYGQSPGGWFLTGVRAIAAGGAHTVALKSDGTVVARGWNVSGQTTVPLGLSGVRAIAAGGHHTVALSAPALSVGEDSGPYLAGANFATGLRAGPVDESGQALTFTVSNDNNALFSAQPEMGTNGTLTFTPATNASGSATVTVRLTDDDTIGGVGSALSMEKTFVLTVTPVNDVPVASAQEVTTAEDEARAITLAGTDGDGDDLAYTVMTQPTNGTLSGTAPALIYTPNANFNGRDSFTFTVNAGPEVSAVATVSLTVGVVNDAPDFALRIGGTVVAWGNNDNGQTNVPWGLSGVRAIAAGGSHTVALKTNGTVVAWGDNGNGQTNVPSGLSGVSAIAAVYYHTVALKTDGTVVAWGKNDDGQTNVPSGLSGVSAIAAGGHHTVALKTDGTVVAWGWNGNGQTNVPSGLSGVMAIAAGYANTVALKTDGTVVAWGANYYGQTNVPSGLSGVSAIAAGGHHTVALKTDGTVVAWGFNWNGQTNVPSGLSGVSAIAAGSSHTVALKTDGTVVAWGANYSGRTTVPSGLTGVVAIAAGGAHTVALSALALSVGEDSGPYLAGANFATGLRAGPVDESGQALTFTVSNDNNLLFSAQPEMAANGTLTFTPATNASGSATVTVRLTDDDTLGGAGSALSTEKTFVLTVMPVEDAPVASAQEVTTAEDEARAITLAGTDADGDDLAYTVMNQPTNGTLSGTAPALIYTPNADFNGRDSFTFTVNDGPEVSAVATVSLTVTPVNDTPDFGLRIEGAVVAWGYNDDGQTTVPSGLSGVMAMAAGRAHTVALKTDGTVVAWGDNSGGQTNVPSGLSGVSAIAAGVLHTVALKTDGTVVAWGNNDYGQTNVPSGLTGVRAIAASGSYTVALKTDGTVVAWGYNGNGQTNVPSNLSEVRAIAAGAWHTVAMKTDGTVVAWGNNSYGQTNVPSDLSGVRAIAAGEAHTVALKTDGTVVAWGRYNYGQTTVPWGLSGVGAIAAGGSHTVALKTDGTVVAWGRYNYGQTDVPSGLSGVRSIAAGGSHTVALSAPALSVGDNSGPYLAGADFATGLRAGPADESGQALTFTVSNDNHALFSVQPEMAANGTLSFTPATNATGSATVTVRLTDDDTVGGVGSALSTEKTFVLTVTPVDDAPVASAQEVTTAEDEAVAITLAGTDSEGGDLAYTVVTQPTNGTLSGTAPARTYTPNANFNGRDSFTFTVNDGTADSAVATVSLTVTPVNDAPSFGLRTDGTVVAWGSNDDGQTMVPSGLSGVSAIAASYLHTVALKTDGTVVAWGNNDNGQTDVPSGLSGVGAIAAGGFHTVALKAHGTVVAWGYNDNGQTNVPSGLSGVSAIAAGYLHTVALKTDGTVVAWGANGFGQTNVPPGLSGVSAIAAGWHHTVALKADGTVVAWGNNGYSQTTVPSGLSGVRAIAAGVSHTVVLKTDGTVVAWGLNANGQTTVPSGLSGVSAIAAGWSHTVALKTDGTVVAWGGNGNGQTDVPSGLTGVGAIAAGGSHTVALSDMALSVGEDSGPYLAGADFATDLRAGPADESGQALTFTVSNDNNALFSVQPEMGTNGTLTFTPAADRNGSATVTVRLTDDDTIGGAGSALSTEKTFVLTVTPVNDTPVASAQEVTTAEDEARAITLAGTDAEGSALTYTVVTQPTNGTLSGTAPALTYTPNANFNGRDSFTFTVNDGTADSAMATVNLTVTPVNDAPVASTQEVTTAEDEARAITLAGTDAEGSALTYTVVTQPTNGTLSGPAPALTYTPNTDFNGRDSFTFTVNDGTADSAMATVNLTVTPVNDAPDFVLATEGAVVAWGANGSGQTNVPSDLSGVRGIAAGSLHTVALKTDGTVVAWGYNDDGQTNVPSSLSGVGAIAANGLHTVAVKTDGTVVAWGHNGYGQTTVPSGLSGVSAIAAGYLHTVALKTDGTVVAWGDNEYGQTNVPSGLSGVSAIASGDRHTVALKTDGTVVAWGHNGYDQTTVPSGLSGVRAIAAGGFHTVALKTDGTVVVWGYNWDGQTDVPSGLSGVGAIAAGYLHTVALKTDGTVVAWGDNWFGQRNVPSGLSGVGAIAAGGYHTVALSAPALSVGEDSGPYLAGADFATGVSAGPADESGQALTFTVTNDNNLLFSAQPEMGTNGTLTFTPATNASGNATVTVRLTDDDTLGGAGSALTMEKTFVLTVTPVDDVPVASAQEVTTAEDEARAITLAGTDADGDDLDYTVVTQPTNGTLSGPAPALIYTPNANFNGRDSFTFTVNDGTADSAVATVSLTVTPVNDAPVASAQEVTTAEDEARAITLAGTDTEGSALTYTVVTQPTNGTLSGTAPTLIYTPNADFNGRDSFMFTVNDGTADSAVATVSLTVTPVNDAPDFVLQPASGGTVAAWGYDGFGQRNVPSGLLGVGAIAAGGAHTVALQNNGTVVAWGNNEYGQRNVPSGLSGVSAIAAGSLHTVALKTDGTVVAWGNNGNGQTNVPSGLSGVSAIAAGWDHTVALKADGTVVAWGNNSSGQTNVPSGLSGVRAIAAGGYHTVALKTDGTVVAWGYNSDGQTNVPSGLSGVRAIAAGGFHTVALKRDGTVVAWGANWDGQTNLPSGLSGVGAIAAGYLHTVALKRDGTVVAWGKNDDDQTNVPSGLAGVRAIAAGGYHTVALSAPALSVGDNSGPYLAGADFATGLRAGPADESGQALTFTVSNNNHALFSVQPEMAANGTLTFTPATNATGRATVTVRLTDDDTIGGAGSALSTEKTFVLTVTPVEDAPVASAQEVTTAEDEARAITLAGTDSEGGELTYTVVTQPTNGTLSGTAPALTYTPNANFNGRDSFTFTVNDGTADSAVATVSLTVTPVNDAPDFALRTEATVVAWGYNGYGQTTVPWGLTGVGAIAAGALHTVALNDMALNVGEDSGHYLAGADFATDLRAGPADESGQALTFTVSNDNNALFSVQPEMGTNGTLTFTPAADRNGSATVTVRLTDDDTIGGAGSALSTEKTFVLTVTPVEDAPVASAQEVTTAEDEARAITLTGTDADGDDVAYTVVTQPTNGTLSGTAPALTYTPNADFNGRDSFTFTVNDGTAESAVATVSLTVTPVNDVPVASAQEVTTAEDEARAITLAGTDAEGSALTYTVVTQPTNGTLNGTVPALTYTPNANFNGRDSFTFTVNDGTAVSAVATVSLTVTPVEDAPVATAQEVTTAEDETRAITLAGTDSEGSDLAYTVVTQPTNGTLSGTAPALTYTPNANFNGRDSFTFTVNDGTADSAVATVNLTVTPVNDTPDFALATEGAVVAWGANGNGQTTVPSGLTGVGAIAVGEAHTVALKTDGTVVAWGNNEYGQTNVPPGLAGVSAISAGSLHTVALKADGTVVAWGNNEYGQTNVPSGLSGVRAIAAGGYHTVALKTDGTVVAWGNNDYGQTNVPSGLSGVKAIAAGGFHTVALKTDGTVVVWGNNDYGQTNVPSGLSGVSAIAAGGLHTVVLKTDGTVVAWGWNDDGQTTVPSGLSGVSAIAAGGLHTVVLKTDGTVVAWGWNDDGQTNVPSGLSGVGAIAAGGFHTVALIAPALVSVGEDSGPYLAGANFATGLRAGPVDESGQALTFTVTNDNNLLFSAQPEMGTNGTLTFTPATNASGSATVTVRLTDDDTLGGAGSALSTEKTFVITVTPVNDAPTIARITHAGANMIVAWTSVAGRSYRLRYTEDIAGTWLDLPGDVTATGTTAEKSVVVAGGRRFYRVQVLP